MTMDAHSPYFIKGRPLDSSRSEGTFRRDHHRLQPLGEGLGLDLNARCTSCERAVLGTRIESAAA
jgi:hypothetical protein